MIVNFMYLLIFNSFHFFLKNPNIISNIDKFIGQFNKIIIKLCIFLQKFYYINLQSPIKTNIL